MVGRPLSHRVLGNPDRLQAVGNDKNYDCLPRYCVRVVLTENSSFSLGKPQPFGVGYVFYIFELSVESRTNFFGYVRSLKTRHVVIRINAADCAASSL